MKVNMAADQDLLVCGGCKQDFPFLRFNTFIQHKMSSCPEMHHFQSIENLETALLCQSCPETFSNPMTLLRHAQNDHDLTIYQEQSSQPQEDCCSRSVNEERARVNAAKIRNASNVKNNKRRLSRLERRLSSASCEVGTQQIEASCVCVKAGSSESCCDNARCCNNENCGVTVMPGTHEPAKKCCQAVVPKKRKRHMEMKHMPSLKAKRKALSITRSMQPPAKTGPASIIIDFGTNELSNSQSNHSENSGTNVVNTGSKSSNYSALGLKTSFTSGDFKKHSVIIPPGGTFSVPAYITQVLQNCSSASSENLAKKDTLPKISFPENIVPLAIVPNSQVANTTTQPNASRPMQTSRENSKIVSYVTSLLQKSANSQEALQESDILLKLFNSGQTGSDSVTKRNAEEQPGEREILMCKSTAENNDNQQAIQEDYDDTTGMDMSDPSGNSHNDSLEGSTEDGGSDMNSQKKKRYPTSRPFKCDQCDHSFNQRIHLKKHQSKHTGIKPFKCGQCDYATVERSHLKVHIRVHTGEKPFKCTYCEYATAQNSTLKIHLKRHHGTLDTSSNETDSILHCSMCKKPFPQRGMLDNHVAKEHQRITESELSESTAYENEESSINPLNTILAESTNLDQGPHSMNQTKSASLDNGTITIAEQVSNPHNCLDEIITDLQTEAGEEEAVNFQKLLEAMMAEPKSVDSPQTEMGGKLHQTNFELANQKN